MGFEGSGSGRRCRVWGLRSGSGRRCGVWGLKEADRGVGVVYGF
jgi:hypothetical protein